MTQQIRRSGGESVARCLRRSPGQSARPRPQPRCFSVCSNNQEDVMRFQFRSLLNRLILLAVLLVLSLGSAGSSVAQVVKLAQTPAEAPKQDIPARQTIEA